MSFFTHNIQLIRSAFIILRFYKRNGRRNNRTNKNIQRVVPEPNFFNKKHQPNRIQPKLK